MGTSTHPTYPERWAMPTLPPPRRQGCLEISRLRHGQAKNDKSIKPEKSPHPAPRSPPLKGPLAPLKGPIGPVKRPTIQKACAGRYAKCFCRWCLFVRPGLGKVDFQTPLTRLAMRRNILRLLNEFINHGFRRSLFTTPRPSTGLSYNSRHPSRNWLCAGCLMCLSSDCKLCCTPRTKMLGSKLRAKS